MILNKNKANSPGFSPTSSARTSELSGISIKETVCSLLLIKGTVCSLEHEVEKSFFTDYFFVNILRILIYIEKRF